MLNLSDKELDHLSREAAEQYEPDEDISSWERLEQQLGRDIEDKPPALPPRFRAIGYGSVLLLLVGASYFLIKSGNDKKYFTQKKQVTTETNRQSSGAVQTIPTQIDHAEKRAGTNTNSSLGDSKNETTPTETSSATTNIITKKATKQTENDPQKTQQSISDEKDGIIVSNDEKNNSTSINNHLIDKNKETYKPRQKIIPKNKSNNISAKHDLVNDTVTNATRQAENKNDRKKSNGKKLGTEHLEQENGDDLTAINGSSALSLTKTGKLSGKNHITGNNITENPKYAVLPDLESTGIFAADISDSSLLKAAANAGSNNNSPEKKNQQASHINRSLKIGLLYAPDYTKVGAANSNKLSTNIGITIGYQFADKWSVNTGLIYTKKNYASNGKDFHQPSGYPSPNTYFDYVTGYCTMWEIPLSLRYDFAATRKNSFFITAGLSSYLMKHESYIVESHWGYGPTYGRGSYALTIDSHKDYLLSVAGLSFGMEHQFNKKFSLQVEPFFKIPLIGVGFGKLQLNSYGVNFSLRYAPLLHTSRH